MFSFNTKAVEYLNLENTKIPKDVTVESLLTHGSGIEDYLELFMYKEPVSKVNEKYHYSGAGYAVKI